eukprot:4909521-Amphidinium_carterae.1
MGSKTSLAYQDAVELVKLLVHSRAALPRTHEHILETEDLPPPLANPKVSKNIWFTFGSCKLVPKNGTATTEKQVIRGRSSVFRTFKLHCEVRMGFSARSAGKAVFEWLNRRLHARRTTLYLSSATKIIANLIRKKNKSVIKSDVAGCIALADIVLSTVDTRRSLTSSGRR